MADWRREAARAAEAERDDAPHEDEWHDLGEVIGTEDGGLAVDLRGRRLGRLHDIRLAGSDGPRGGAAVPVGARLHHGVLWLDDPGPLPSECARVWARWTGTRDECDTLVRTLRRADFAPLADRLADGRPDRAYGDPYGACFLPGVRLIWGPPGTGKTTLLAKAADELAGSGKRVLFLTGTEQALSVPADPQRLAVQQQLAALSAQERRLAELDHTLAGFDHAAFLAVEQRIANHRRAHLLEPEFAKASQEHDVTAKELAAARQELRTARAAWDEVAEQRELLAESRTLTARLTTTESDIARLSERLHRRFYRGRRADRKALRANEKRRSELAERLAELDRALADAHRRLDAAARDEAHAYTSLEYLRGKIAQLRSVGAPSTQDQRFHAECVRLELPDLHDERERLRAESDERAARRGRLEERLWWLGDRAYQRRRQAGSGLLTRASSLPELEDGELFDVVLVDDAGSRRLAEVLAAVALARHTAVVAGDFGSPGPRVPPRLRERPEVRRWSVPTAFAHCGIRKPEDAEEHPGCHVLTTQYRFGDAVRMLADHLGVPTMSGDGVATEVVLLDTGGQPARHATVAAAMPLGDTAVVAPHRTAAATWATAARDRLDIAVGTGRTVCGQEFETVLVDLTTDDWSARTRAFVSAVTRPCRRLYLLADLSAVRAAAPGTPLGAIEALRRDGALTVRPAGELLIPQPRQAVERSARDGDQPAHIS